MIAALTLLISLALCGNLAAKDVFCGRVKSIVHTEPSQRRDMIAKVQPSAKGFRSSQQQSSRQQKPERTLRDFSSRDSRLGFIRKVYGIFGAQIGMTILVTYILLTQSSVLNVLLNNLNIVVWTSFLGSLALIFALKQLATTFPVNLILVGLFTLLQSITVGVFASFYDLQSVCIGSLHTLGAFLAITLFSLQPDPRYDLTPFGSTLLAALFSLIIVTPLAGLLGIGLPQNLMASVGAIIFAGYIAYDTQMIVGGKHRKKQYHPDQYIDAAMSLYLDAINLFMEIMRIMGKQKNERRQK